MTKRRPDNRPPPAADVSPDDLALFEREAEVTRKLDRDGAERIRPLPEPRVTAPPVSSGPPDDVDVDAAALDSYAAPGVDRRELRKLKRGDHAPDLRIDLHGLMATEAVKRVTQILDRASGQRPRCLCVVHGRGLHSPGNVAVLKVRVRAALRAHPAVLAFSDAPAGDGGNGAVYVLLRR